MLIFGLISSKVCITYSRCTCNKLWWRLESLNIQTTEVSRQSTKQLLNNFLARFFRKAGTIFGARLKNGLFINKKVYFFKKSFSNFQETELSYVLGKGISRTVAYLELEAYSEPEVYSEHYQTPTLERFAKIAT